ncbi:VTC domain-containing protein [Clostridium perfringens]|nr:VTC domain-containing protein [Clostridium perfringens]
MIVNRRELKYVISEFDYYKLENLLKKILIPDKNNGSYGYSIRSLYFDSIDNCDYYAKLGGEEVRKKLDLGYIEQIVNWLN